MGAMAKVMLGCVGLGLRLWCGGVGCGVWVMVWVMVWVVVWVVVWAGGWGELHLQ